MIFKMAIWISIAKTILFILFQQGYCSRVVEHFGPNSDTTFQLTPYESSEKLVPINVLTGIGSVHQCQVACSQEHTCLSFNYKPTKNQTCEIFDDIDNDPSKVDNGIHGKVTNRKGVAFDCVESAWSEWSECRIDNFWDYCGITNTSKVECHNFENRSREVIETNEYGGVTCHTYEQRERNACSNMTGLTHILLLGGRNGDTSEKVKTMLDFVPEIGRMVVLSQELGEAREDHTSVLHGNHILIDGSRVTIAYFGVSSTESIGSMPLQHQALGSYISKQRYGGCSAVVGSNLYHCFGRGAAQTDYMSHCDVYNMNDDYSHHQLSTDVPAHLYSSCLLDDNNLLYIIGGYTSGGKQRKLYKLDLMTGTKLILSNFPYAAHSLSSVWYHGNIVACGGNLGGTRSADCSAYNISSNIWDVNFPNMVIAKSHFEMVNWGPVKILAIGGDAGGASSFLSSIEVYDGTSWTVYAPAQLPYALRGMSAVVLEP